MVVTQNLQEEIFQQVLPFFLQKQIILYVLEKTAPCNRVLNHRISVQTILLHIKILMVLTGRKIMAEAIIFYIKKILMHFTAAYKQNINASACRQACVTKLLLTMHTSWAMYSKRILLSTANIAGCSPVVILLTSLILPTLSLLRLAAG